MTIRYIESEYQYFPKNIPCCFLSKNIKEHFATLKENFQKRTENSQQIEDIQIVYLFNKAKIHDELEAFYILCIEWYSESCCYDEADYYFKILINPYYKKFSLDLLLLLINSSSKNPQTYDRRKAEYEHKLIAKRFIELGGDISQIDADWSNWDSIINNIE